MLMCLVSGFNVLAQSVNGPVMKFEVTTIDYGTVPKGADPIRKFIFTNMGNEPLIIKSARGSSRSTVPTYPTEPIMPGELKQIDVRYDTQRLGKFTETVTMTTNETPDTWTLTIKGEIVSQIVSGPNVPNQTKPKELLNAEAVTALLDKLKEGLLDLIDDEAQVEAISEKWDAREDLVGKPKAQILKMLFADVKSVIKDKETQDNIWSNWMEAGSKPDKEENQKATPAPNDLVRQPFSGS